MNKYAENKIKGMLIGLHCGDSLGSTLEFNLENPTPSHREIIGGGVFDWDAGQATDDTDLMLVVLASLENNTFNEDKCVQGLIDWLARDPVDVGATTRRSIDLLRQSLRPAVYEDQQGNGSLMRSCPLALIDFSEEVIQRQCALTHPHPSCVFADKVYVYLLQMLLDGKSREEVYDQALHLSQSLPDLHQRIKAIPNVAWEDLNTSGFVLDTLAAGIWALYHAKSFEEALVLEVNRGDDADTCGAVAGALCGAYWGLENIPDRWVSVLEYRDKIMNF